MQGKAGAYAGAKKYGDAANLPTTAMKGRGSARSSSSRTGGPSVPSPLVGEGQGGGPTSRGGRGSGKSGNRDPLAPSLDDILSGGSRSASKVHKPHLDEMHGPESLPYRPNAKLPPKPFGGSSKIIQPTNSRESGPEFGPAPRSTGGAPGKRGGWKKR